jgi:hypothetical protein
MATIVGAYAASPANAAWNENEEEVYYNGLKAIPGVRGLEIPFTGALHPHDEAWLLRTVRKDWDFVVTCIPGTMQALASDRTFGLASDDAAGRKRAIDFAAKARDAVGRINAAVGRNAVIAVEVHSAPTQVGEGKGSACAFVESLAEIARWDWQGARIVVEHCDAYRAGHPPIKGFLTLEDELKAIAAANKSARKAIGVSINWGRSVLETRRIETAVQHIRQSRDAGVLCGLMFSGTSGAATPYGAWVDSHMPHAPAPGVSHAAEDSLMTEAEIAASLAAAGKIEFVGAKIGIRPPEATVATRLGLIGDLLKLIDRNAEQS